MGKPTNTQVRVDKVLTNLSIAYSNDEYIADMLMPTQKVKERTGLFYKYDRSKFRALAAKRAPGTAAPSIDYGLSTDTYGPVQEYSLKAAIPKEVLEQADTALDPFKDAANTVMEMHWVTKEKELAAAMIDTANITQNTTLSGTSQWSDYANSDPIQDIETGRNVIHAAIFKEPNTLTMSRLVYRKLVNHPDLIARVSTNRNKVLTLADLKNIFEIDRILVGAAGYNNTTEGQTDDMDYIWGKHAWLTYVDSRMSLRTITLGWNMFVNKAVKTTKWWDEDLEQWYVRTSMERKFEFVAPECAYGIFDAIA